MGYKSVLRSLSAASNAANKSAAKRLRAQEKELEKVQGKVSKLEEKKAAILDALEDAYVKNKVTDEEYKALKPRMDEVGLDLLVFGSSPAVALAKQYVSGKIDQAEFQKKQMGILPEGLFSEREEIGNGFSEAEKKLEDFLSSCRKQDGVCYCCGAKKGFLKWLYLVDELQLCSGCKAKLAKLKKYNGFEGQYFSVRPVNLAEKGESLSLEIKREHLLRLR